MLVRNIILLSIIVLYSSFPVLICRTPNLKFDHLTVNNGLSNNFIRSIAQDSTGFMWFATEDGLNKYDGYSFTVYRHDPANPTSLSENKVEVLLVDKAGILWVGTNGGGLNAFNPQTGKFTRYNMDPDDPNGNSTEYITDIYEDKSGNIWFSVQDKGLYCYDPEKDSFKRYAHDPDDPNTLSSHIVLRITSTMCENKEIIWVGTWGNGLDKFDPEKNQWTHFRYDPQASKGLSDDYIDDVYTDNSGILWITNAWNGLHKMDPITERFTVYRYDPSSPNSLSDNMGGEMWEKDGFLWITTMNGLNRLDIKKEELKSWFNNPSDPQSIGQNSHWRIFESKGDVLWIGGWAGLDMIDFEQKPFVSYQKQPGNPNSLSDNFVCAIQAIHKEEGDIVWIGTKDGGLNKINRSTGQVTHYEPDPSDPNSLSTWFIFSIAESSYKGKKELWLGTMAGLNRFDSQSGKFTHYNYDPDDTTSVSEDLIHKVYAGSNGYIWVGTQNQGLCRFDPVTQKFKRYHHSTGEVWVILEDSTGCLWHGSVTHGLMKLDPLTKQLTYYKHNLQDSNSISSNTIRSIYESFFNGKHVLWVGTNTGLNRFDYKTEKFYHYTRKNGLPSDEINGILEDKNGNLWLGTGYGLSRFEPESGTVRNYDKDDALPGNQFLRGSYFMAENGEMFFGSTDGFVSFFPKRIKENPHIPEIVLTDLQIFNKSVMVKKDRIANDDDYFLPKHISFLNQIELSYDQSVFSFEFAALDFRKPQKNQYAYMMEGVDPEWVYTDASRRFATYTNLDPGEYTFRVKGSNSDGIWNEAGTSIKVIITPPWWETKLAYAFYVLLMTSIVIATWRLQLKRIKIKQQLQMKQFEAEKLHEVDNLKSRFFANISHEFRTPLTLIKGPVKQIMDGAFTGNLKEQCKMILRNSDRLLGLINQILDLSKLESGEIKLKVVETDIIEYLKGIALSFSSFAESKKVILKFSCPENPLIGYVDLDKLEKIITNLLSNAFKFTPEGGVVDVNLTPLPLASPLMNKGGIKGGSERYIQINISNTSPGIPPAQLDKIFDRFYSAPLDRRSLNNRNVDDGYPTGQADNNYKKNGEGTGIGLALTKELVEVCHGEISVSSILGKSTTFEVKLPIAKECFKDDEVVEKKELGYRKSDIGISISQENADVNIPQPDRSPASRLQFPLLLIVEDNPDVTSYISSFMANDYRILTAENGREGLKKTLDKYPDLIISDVMMPEMDGFEFCQKVKSDERISHIPVMLLTAKADLDSKIEGLEFGCDDYVTKPFEARELQIRVKNLIEQRRKLREKFSALIDLNPADIAASSMDEQLLQRLLNVFEDHMEEPDFSIEQLAEEIGISRKHLNRKIQAITNLSTNDFIRTLRLQKAARLLKSASGTVSEIAYKVGFNNLSYFSKTFRRHFGKLPSEFIIK